MRGLSDDQVKTLARDGAVAHVKRLTSELQALYRAFPDLKSNSRPIKRRKSTMSAEARKAVSQRMKKIWAERRKAKS